MGVFSRLPLFALGMLASIAVQAEPISNGRTELQVAELLAGLTPSKPWRMDAFAPQADAQRRRWNLRSLVPRWFAARGLRGSAIRGGGAVPPPCPARVDPADGNAILQTDSRTFGVSMLAAQPAEPGRWTRRALPFSLME
jgi:hypothetical protein